MTVIISSTTTKEELETSLKGLNKTKGKSLKKHFGLSETKIDAIAFQKQVRNEWN
jgi:hypothetical protein